MSLFQRMWANTINTGLPSINAQEASARLQSTQPPLVLDVRQPEEFRDGHIPGAKLIPLGELDRRMKDLPRDRAILCVCQGGGRSGTATKRLAQAGFKAINLSGGMIGWAQARLPVER